ncbi:hypothetical protein [Streptomyces flaveolus]|uniref:hypothetical protein n=1 Tax=Streptomyces flaveolus TaxID=67297 RepID=UPI0037F6D657
MTLIEMALAFALNHPAVASVLMGPRTLQHLDTQLPAADVTPYAQVLDRIDEIVAPGHGHQPGRHQLHQPRPGTGGPPPLTTPTKPLRSREHP